MIATNILERVRAHLLEHGREPSVAEVNAALRDEGLVVGDGALLALAEALRSEMLGAGPLDTLLKLEGVTDVLVNGPNDVWFDRGRGLELSGVRFPDEATLRRLAQRLAASAGRRLDDAAPFVDARLPQGQRFHAVLPPLSGVGTAISLRVPSHQAMSLGELAHRGSFPEQIRELLEAVVRARLCFLISGGTGSGKTTLLNAMLSAASADERIIAVEDTGELKPIHPHVVTLQTRVANVEGSGAIELRDLVRQALRMRPDRVVLGEVRGAEVVDLLTALNTGHEGGAATVHARSAGAVPARLAALGLLAGVSGEALAHLAGAALDLVIHVQKGPDGTRGVSEISRLQLTNGELTTSPALSVAGSSITEGPAAGWFFGRLGSSYAGGRSRGATIGHGSRGVGL